MLAEAVVEQRARVLAEGQHDPSLRALAAASLASISAEPLSDSSPRQPASSTLPKTISVGSGRLGDLVGLVEQRRGRGQLALEAPQQRVAG